MKAAELKELIAEIPDNEEVYYGYYSQDYEENRKDDDFDVRLFFEKNGVKFYLIGGPKPCDAISQEEVERAQKWQNIVKSFPQKKGWFLEQPTWKNNGGHVSFKTGLFEYSINITIGKNKLIDANFEQRESFDSWEEFFDKAVPYVKKAAQKQREELESLLDE
jgi:hypothetical protein